MFEINTKQIKRLANIFDNAGQVCLGSLVLNSLNKETSQNNINIIIIGILMTLLCWYFSLKLEKIIIWTSHP